MSKRSFKGSSMLNPVPVVLITSKNSEGKVNVFTVAWAGTICTKPAMVSISVRPERLSYDYIKQSGEFVINLPNKSQVRAVDYCGVRSGRTNDKIKECKFTLDDSTSIETPMIKECPVAMECRVKEILPLGSHHLFIAEVTAVHVEDDLIDSTEKIHLEKANLISYSHGEYFPIENKAIGKFGYSVKKPVKKAKK